MKLQSLIAKTNKTYELGLNSERLIALHQKMRVSGHAQTIGKGRISPTIDAILTTADSLPPSLETDRATRDHVEVYASLKVEAAPSLAEDSCPRCKVGVGTVELVGGRQAAYCQSCSIVLPFMVD